VFPRELGTPVSIPDCLIVTDEFAFALDQFVVHRPGFFVRLRIISRDPRLGAARDILAELFLQLSADRHCGDSFRWGIEFNDGRRAVAGVYAGSDFAIVQQGAVTTAERCVMDYYVHAIPSVQMTFHITMPRRGISERRVTVGVSTIIDASMNDTLPQLWR
jgi:hypothetical protein